jgi:hypothetical protein
MSRTPNRPADPNSSRSDKSSKPKKLETWQPAPLSDEEWLETHCSKMMSILPYKAAYKRDAILYGRMAEKIIALRTSAKKPIAEAKKPAENGLFFSFLFKITRAAHPMNWLICDGCNGHGHKPDDKTQSCMKCFGGGYRVKFEET